MEAQEVLKKFGLTDMESKLYLMLLKTGETTASKLAAKLKIPKTTAYDLLAVLERKGLASCVIHEGLKQYSPIDPKHLLDKLEERMVELKSIYPTLESYYSSTKSEREIRVFEGNDGIKTMLNDMILVGKPVYALGSSLQMFSLMGHRMVHPLKNARRAIPYCKVVLSDKKKTSESLKKFREFYPKLEVRYYPEKTSVPVAFNTYGDRITLMIWQEEAVLICIRDPCIARAFKNNFDLIWSLSTE